MINVNPTITSLSESSAKLSGDLNAHTVTALLPQGLKLLNQAPEAWLLDMTDVKQVSSAAVALLLEWLKQAEQSNKRIEITGMPRSEEHTSELQSRPHLVCRLLLEKKKK